MNYWYGINWSAAFTEWAASILHRLLFAKGFLLGKCLGCLITRNVCSLLKQYRYHLRVYICDKIKSNLPFLLLIWTAYWNGSNPRSGLIQSHQQHGEGFWGMCGQTNCTPVTSLSILAIKNLTAEVPSPFFFYRDSHFSNAQIPFIPSQHANAVMMENVTQMAPERPHFLLISCKVKGGQPKKHKLSTSSY